MGFPKHIEHNGEIQVLQYVEHLWPQGTLAQLWTTIMADKLTPLLWGTGIPMSLNEFIRFFDPLAGRVLFIPLYVPSGEEIKLEQMMGAMWATEYENHHKAWVHFLFFKKCWGDECPLIAGRKGIEMIFSAPFNLQMLLYRVNDENQFAKGMVKKLNAVKIGVVPNFYKHGEACYGAEFGYILRDDFMGG